MLSENIKKLRLAKGLSQTELASRLHVVRQTISKWEKGLSVPDAALLIRLAEALDTSVTALLGEPAPQDAAPTLAELAARLEHLNNAFSRRTELRRRGWRIFFSIGLGVTMLSLIFTLLTSLPPSWLWESAARDVAIIGGADGPTTVFVSDIRFQTGAGILFLILIALLMLFGIVKTRRR